MTPIRQQNRRVGTASPCPRVTVEKGENDKEKGEIFVGKPRNPRGHKIVPTLQGLYVHQFDSRIVGWAQPHRAHALRLKKGEKDRAQEEIFVGKPRNSRGHKKRAHPTRLLAICKNIVS